MDDDFALEDYKKLKITNPEAAELFKKGYDAKGEDKSRYFEEAYNLLQPEIQVFLKPILMLMKKTHTSTRKIIDEAEALYENNPDNLKE